MKYVKRNSLLNKSKVEYADYAINHIEGCSHGCLYCYAMAIPKRFGKIKDYRDWIKPKLVGNAVELLEKEIPKLKNKIKSVFLCFTTDPFMYKQAEAASLSLEIIQRLNQDNICSKVLTKGVLPSALANKEKYGINNEYGITLVSLSEEFRQKWEPGSAPLQARIKALKHLHDRGLKTFVSMEPYPTRNMADQDINKILESVKFVDKIIFGRIHYNSSATNYLKGDGDYYRDRVEIVVQFCKKNGIECYIKYKTLKTK